MTPFGPEQEIRQVAYDYDLSDNVKKVTDATRRFVRYDYDAENRLEKVTLANDETVQYRRLANGLLDRVEYGTGFTRSFTYDAANRIKTITNTAGGESESYGYDYDPNGNRIRETRNRTGQAQLTITYDHDLLDRLKRVDFGTSTVNYTYDAVGNRKTEIGTRPNGQAVDYTYTYDAANQLRSITDGTGSIVASYGYDVNGNVTSWTQGNTSWTYDYDVREQLVKATRTVVPQTGPAETASGFYEYDYDKRRIGRKWADEGWIRSVYAEDQIVNEFTDAGALVNRYEYGLGVLRGETDGYHFGDALGSVTLVAGTQTVKTDYDPWGVVLAGQRTGSSIGYTGQWGDEQTGLMPLGNGERYYLPGLGRFVQEDSVQGILGIPQSYNRYAYVHNNPTKFTDPTGNVIGIDDILIVYAVGFAIGFAYNAISQGLQIAEGSRQNFSLYEAVGAGTTGGILLPIIAFVPVAGPALGYGLTAYGAYQGVEGIMNGRPLSGTFDLLASIVPVAWHGLKGKTPGATPEITGENPFLPASGRTPLRQRLRGAWETFLDELRRPAGELVPSGEGAAALNPNDYQLPGRRLLDAFDRARDFFMESRRAEGGSGGSRETVTQSGREFAVEPAFEGPPVEEWAHPQGLDALERHLIRKGWDALLEADRRGLSFWEKFRVSGKDDSKFFRGRAADALFLRSIREINNTLKAKGSPYLIAHEPVYRQGRRISLPRSGQPKDLGEGIFFLGERKGIIKGDRIPDAIIVDTRISQAGETGRSYPQPVSIVDISFGSLNQGPGKKGIIMKYESVANTSIFDVRVRNRGRGVLEPFYIPVRRR